LNRSPDARSAILKLLLCDLVASARLVERGRPDGADEVPYDFRIECVAMEDVVVDAFGERRQSRRHGGTGVPDPVPAPRCSRGC
jgi:hypothetical protein